MSYDLWMESTPCAHCGRGEEHVEPHGASSPTYSYGPMIREADRLAGGEGCSFAALAGKTGAESLAWLTAIRTTLVDNERAIRPLEPSNGWGTFGSLVDVFDVLIRTARANKAAVWHQCGDGAKAMRCCAGWVCGEVDRAR